MAWRDNLMDATLEGVAFHYKEVSNRFGRRTITHEYPNRDDAWVEDLGMLPRRYPVKAFILDENYAERREALIEVLERGGDLEFVHPYRGIFTVRLEGEAEEVERDDEGRMAAFTFTLVQQGLAFPLIPINTPPFIRILADDVMGKLPGKKKFDLLGAIGAVLKSVANAIGAAGSAVRKVNGKIGGTLGLVDNITSSIDDLTKEINTLLNTPTALMNTITGLVSSVMRLVETFIPEAGNLSVEVAKPDLPGIVLDALEEFDSFRTEPSAIPTPTEQSTIEQNAHATITAVVKTAGLVAATDVLAQLPLESSTQALAIVQTLDEKFSAALAQDFDEDVLDGLAALKSAAVEHFRTVAQELPAVTTHTPPRTLPALVLAHQLYGDASREVDLIARNKIRHPAFVVGGRTLEVLTGDG